MKRFILGTAVAVALSMSAAAQVRQQQVVVPAFFNLSTRTDGNTYDWMRIVQAGAAVKIVVPNLNNFDADAGTTQCLSSPQAVVSCLRSNHTTLVLGYVDTSTARRTIDNILHGGDVTDAGQRIVSVDDWYGRGDAGFPPVGPIDGIFFDQGPVAGVAPEDTLSAYYQTLYQDMKAMDGGAPTYQGACQPTSNAPGQYACVMLNASQYPDDWVKRAADYATMYERPVHGSVILNPKTATKCPTLPDGGLQYDQQDYLIPAQFCPAADAGNSNCTNYQDAGNWYNANAGMVAHVLYSADAGDVSNVIAASRNNYGTPALVYLHDQDCAQYSHLSGLFEQTVGALNPPLNIVLPVTQADGGVTNVVLAF
jgi:hypothetical protein